MMSCGKVLIIFGRLIFVMLMIAQCLLLASFPAKYQNNSAWYASLLLIAPVVGISWWWTSSSSNERTIAKLVWSVWFAYVWVALVPMIGIVFGVTEDKLDRDQQFGPNDLKVSLCITPLLLMLLLNTGANSNSRQVIAALSVYMAIDVFDGNELLEIVIDESINRIGFQEAL